MSIKDFFRKIGRGIRNVAGKVWNGVKKGLGFVGRIAKPVVNIAKPALGALGALPGKLGLIGKVGSAVTGVASNIIDKIPNQQVKDKLNRVVDKVNTGVGKVQDKAQQIAGKVAPYAQAAQSIIEKPPDFKGAVQGALGK